MPAGTMDKDCPRGDPPGPRRSLRIEAKWGTQERVEKVGVSSNHVVHESKSDDEDSDGVRMPPSNRSGYTPYKASLASLEDFNSALSDRGWLSMVRQPGMRRTSYYNIAAGRLVSFDEAKVLATVGATNLSMDKVDENEEIIFQWLMPSFVDYDYHVASREDFRQVSGPGEESAANDTQLNQAIKYMYKLISHAAELQATTDSL